MTLGYVVASVIALSAVAHTQAQPAKTLAERLGYKATDRLLIIHADDAGMCHSVNMATIQAMEKGVVTCASIMVPCPWMPEIAAYCREHPDADFGVHLTMNSEWELYRWRPVAPYDRVPGLLDAQGFLYRSPEDTVRTGKPSEVDREIRAQIARALAFGIKPTHIDSHMGTVFVGPFFPVYTKAGKDTGLMPMLPGPTPERIEMARNELHIDIERAYQELSKQGFVFLDVLKEDAEGRTLEARRQHYYDAFRNLKPGVTQFIVHLSLNDEEIRHITGNWEARWNEYQIMTDPKTRELIDSLGIKLIGYKDLAKLAFRKP